MPLTFQIVPVFDNPCTVALNCLVERTLTIAVVGEMVMLTGGGAGAVTVTSTVFEYSPSGVLTLTGTADFATGAVPVAVNRAGETNVVVNGPPSKDTSDPEIK